MHTHTGSLFAKTWRVYRVFHKPQLGMKAIKDTQLIITVLVLLVINILIVGVWQAIDPFTVKSRYSEWEESADLTIQAEYKECQSSYQNIVTTILLGLQVRAET